ncbi:MAG TPA: S8 family serine peptidase [Blastocatellia bacterium]|nr:S8 family serine peptidase [Blastocatellia bacterium]
MKKKIITITSMPRVATALSCLLLLVLASPRLPNSARTVNAAPAQNDELSDTALNQIRALIEAKLARTPAQKKIDSNLLAALQTSRGEPIAANAPALRLDVEFDFDSRVLVDIAASVSDLLLGEITKAGGEVINSFGQYNTIRARIPLEIIETLAGLEGVKSINRAAEAETRRAAQTDSTPAQDRLRSFSMRANRARAHLPQAMQTVAERRKHAPRHVESGLNAAVSTGDGAHTAAQARSAFSVNGSGVKIGVLSDSFDNLGGASADIASGDLPGPGNPNGFTTPVTVLEDLAIEGTDEGRAMLQIVHDLAPGAQLYFATAFGGQANFANNILDLRAAGCDIIIDDVFYFGEPAFQDGPIAQAVDTVTASGALYFSSAGNSGNLNDGTAGAWEGDFVDSGEDLVVLDSINVGRLHRFNAATTLNTINPGGSFRRVDLFWSDPLGQSANDYDIFILDSTGTELRGFSNNVQDGTQDPYEAVGTVNEGEKVAIVKFKGSVRALHLTTGRGRLAIATSGQTTGHACAANAFSVAAVNAASAGGGAFVGGSANPVETFSSDGPRRIFFDANGVALTPGNFLIGTNGGTVRQKPDIAAADGVATTLPPGSGLNPFFGTSAAAPHAGAIAGLLKSFKPELTAPQIRAILRSTAIDIEASGVDPDSGFGIVMAMQALQSAASGANDTIGLYRPSSSTFYLRNSNAFGPPDITVTFGAPGALPRVGDWDGDGVTTIGFYSPGASTFFLRNSNSAGTPHITVPLGDGPNGDIPVAGDWDGDGTWTIGVYRPSTSTFYLRNSNTFGIPDIITSYGDGPNGDIPVVGDWDGDGKWTIGVYRPSSSTFFLRNNILTGPPDHIISFGASGDIPMVGDWDGDGVTTIGLYRPSSSTFYLRNSNTFGGPDIIVPFGAPGDIPVVGDWN